MLFSTAYLRRIKRYIIFLYTILKFLLNWQLISRWHSAKVYLEKYVCNIVKRRRNEKNYQVPAWKLYIFGYNFQSY